MATIELVLAIRDAVTELWRDNAAEIKRRCGPFMPQGLIAKQEVFGFALADALGRPILPGDRAMKVGQDGDNAVRWAEGGKDRPGKLTAQREAARAAVRKAQRAAEKDAALQPGIAEAEANGKAAIAKVLATPVDLDLPNETIGAKRKHAAMAAKPKAPARPSLGALRAAVARAQAAFETAKAVEAADRRRLEQAERKVRDIEIPATERWPTAPARPDTKDIEELKAGVLISRYKSYDAAFDAYLEACERVDAEEDAAMAKFDAAFDATAASAGAVHDELMASSKAVKCAETAPQEAEDAVCERERELEAEQVAERAAKMAALERRLEHAYRERVLELEELCGELKTTVHVLLEMLCKHDPQQHGPALEAWVNGAVPSDEESDDGWDEERMALANEEMRRTSGPAGQRSSL